MTDEMRDDEGHDGEIPEPWASRMTALEETLSLPVVFSAVGQVPGGAWQPVVILGVWHQHVPLVLGMRATEAEAWEAIIMLLEGWVAVSGSVKAAVPVVPAVDALDREATTDFVAELLEEARRRSYLDPVPAGPTMYTPGDE